MEPTFYRVWKVGKLFRVIVYTTEYYTTERTLDRQEFPSFIRALKWVSNTYPGATEEM